MTNEERENLEALDAQIVRLLNERARLARTTGDLEIPSKAIAASEGPLSPDALKAIYREIVSATQALDHKLVVAYLGPPATFTHQAARVRFGASAEYLACETIEEVFNAVQKKTADYGVVPIENSTDGAVTHTLDQFMQTPVKICAEIYLPISHSLLANCAKSDIRRVYSKPEVFSQCRRWLHENLLGVELVSASSTARAAEMAAREAGSAALASEVAAELYGLQVLERDIQDMGGNTTRFLVIGSGYGPPTGRDKTSLLFAVRHRVGALYDALAAFKLYNINMTKIESRPSRTKAWEYCFFVDIEGHVQDPAVQKAIDMLQDHCTFVTVLGAYPRAAEIDS